MGGTNFVPTFRYELRTRFPFRGGCLLFFTVNLFLSGGAQKTLSYGRTDIIPTADGPHLTIFACTIPTEGAPSLRF
jgi:hypothetical protein